MKRAVLTLAAALAILLPHGRADAPGRAAITVEPSQCRGPDLRESDAVLEAQLRAAIATAGWQQLVDEERLAVALLDLSGSGPPVYAGINDDRMMDAASVPKIAILLAVIEAASEGDIQWTPRLERRLRNMIVGSSNPDASWSAQLVGLAAIHNVVRDPHYCLYDDELGGLWMGYAFQRGSAYRPDPLHKIANGATARQVARYYAMLEGGNLVSRSWSYRMLDLMGPPELGHKFVGGLRGRTGVDFLARKSGTWRNYHADSALIQHLGWRYVLVGLTEARNGEQIMRELAPLADDIIQAGAHRSPDSRLVVSGPTGGDDV